jgi:hypothetical protein
MFNRTNSGLYLPAHMSSTPKVARLGNLRIWASNGIICMSRELPDGKEDFKQLSVVETEERAQSLGLELVAMKRNLCDKDVIKAQSDFLDQLHSVINHAKDQGPPENKDCVRARIRRRPTKVRVPGFTPSAEKS